MSSADFMSEYYDTAPKPFIFWDTCALLDAIRFLARKGGLSVFRAINVISEHILTGKCYSLASELFVKEWNDHVSDANNTLMDFLTETTRNQARTIKVINYLYNTNLLTVPLDNHSLNVIFDSITKSIITNTTFIAESDTLKLKAYDRVVKKDPPACKKNEAKDCTIWETALELSSLIKTKKLPYKLNGIFFSSNIEDFVNKDKGRFHSALLLESHNNQFCCCQNYEEVKIKIEEIKEDWSI